MSTNMPAAVWEVRPTVGSDTNGGGFVTGATGTDYSQQTSAQYNLTGCTSSGSGDVVLTISASADMVGNIAYCASGTNFVVGWYEVVSVSVGISITFSLNAAAGNICSGVGASGVINIGGCVATLLPFATSTGASTNGAFAWVKASGTMTITTTLGTFNGAYTISGYTTTRGDGGKATITTATNSIPLFTFNGGLPQITNLILSNTAGTRAAAMVSTGAFYNFSLRISNCIIDGCTSLIIPSFAVNIYPIIVFNTEIKNCTGNGIEVDNNGWLYLIDSYVHNNGGDGIFSASQNLNITVIGSVIANNTSHGIELTNALNTSINLYLHNSVVHNNSGDGIRLTSGASISELAVINCIITSNGGYGINSISAVRFAFSDIINNAFYNNTSGKYDSFITGSIGDITLTGNPFTNSAAGDYTLNNTSGAGAACKTAAYQSTII